MKKIRIIFLLIVIGFFTWGLTGCDKKNNAAAQKKTTIITAKKQSQVTRLFFDGVLNPIETTPVTSPAGGRVAELHFVYGEAVKQGADLMSINATTLAQTYRKTIQSYLSAKEAYTNGIEKYQGDKALYKAGINSRQTFLQNKSTYENLVLKFYQSRFQLSKILKQVGIDPKTIEKLTLADTDKVNTILNAKFKEIVIVAPSAGVALFPVQTSNQDNNKQGGKLHVGSSVKKGELVLSIGNLSGYKVTLQVNEININRIKVGMDATITSQAFPGITLKGRIIQVATQASPGQTGGSGLSTFKVIIDVPNVSAAARKVIRVGMTAKIQINLQELPRVTLPIKAITIKNGQSYVTIMGADGKTRQVNVVTGATSAMGVAIISGVKEGDKVVVND